MKINGSGKGGKALYAGGYKILMRTYSSTRLSKSNIIREVLTFLSTRQ